MGGHTDIKQKVISKLFHATVIAVLCLVQFIPCLNSAAAEEKVRVQSKRALSLLRRQPPPEKDKTLAVFAVETASTPEEKSAGLSGRDELPKDSGMLFILDKNSLNRFWMKGMRFPLDILFFDEHKKLIGMYANQAPCVECLSIPAGADSAYALEINSGMADALGLRPGDEFTLETF